MCVSDNLSVLSVFRFGTTFAYHINEGRIIPPTTFKLERIMKIKNYIVSKATKIDGEELQLHHLGIFDNLDAAKYCVENEIASEEEESGMVLDIAEKEYNDGGKYVKLFHHSNDFGTYEFTIRIEEVENEVSIHRWAETLAYLSADMMPTLSEALKGEGFDSRVAVKKLIDYTDEVEAMVDDELEKNSSCDYDDMLYKFMENHQQELVDFVKD